MKKNYFPLNLKSFVCFMVFIVANLSQAQTTTWDGTAWDNGAPTITEDAIFIGDFTSAADIVAKSVSVTSGAQVTIANGHTFTIENNITVDAGSNLISENNASLLQINPLAVNTGSINFKRNSMPMRQYEFTYWGSPVAGETLIGFSPNTDSDRFYSFNPAPGTNNWVGETNTNIMTPGKGYAIRVPDSYDPVNPTAFSGEFIGTPNNGNVATNVVQFNGAQLNYNLLGNPYPSAINVQTLIDNSTLGTLYLWTHHTPMANNVFTPADYAIRTRNTGTAAYAGGPIPGIYIAAGQGFFASSSTNTTLTFTNTMRVANNNSQFFKTASQPADAQFYYYNMSMTNTTGAFTQISLGYEEGATNGYDFLQDSYQQASTPAKFYSIINGSPGEFAIQGRAFPWTNNDQIQLGYISTIAGNYDITISNVDPFFATQDIFIEDSVTATVHNLKNSAYTFTTGNGTFNNRFKILYVDPTLSNTEFEANSNSVSVSTTENEIVVLSNDTSIKSVQVYDVLGRLIFTEENINTNTFSTTKINSKNQALIIKTQLENSQVVSKKLIF